MKGYSLLCFLFFSYVKYSSATLVDGIITISWSPAKSTSAIDRFLTNNTRIQLKILCREPSINTSVTREQIKKHLYLLDKTVKDINIKIRGRIGRVIGCLPVQSDILLTPSQDKNSQKTILQRYYEQLWKGMEQRTFTASQSDCDYTGTHLNIEQYSNIQKPEISPAAAMKLREEQAQINRNKKVRRASEDYSSPLVNSLHSSTGTLLTWGDGYYIIEIEAPDVSGPVNNPAPDVDVIVSIKNNRGGFITADEYPALVFYAVMCAIYVLFAILWFISSAFYWRELRKIQFWIGGVILISMIEQTTFLAEYNTLNRNGYKVYHAIITAEVLSCLKRTVFRMLVIIIALGYGVVKRHLGPLKQKFLVMGLLYFSIATTEAILRINTKNDETNNKVLISRILLAVGDLIIYYWIVTGLISTTRQLRFKKNLVQLNAYRYFINTIVFVIIASLLFIFWSLKLHYFTTCLTNWREFWVDDAFWHILSSIILLVIMLLFRPSNNNQGDSFIPLLNQSDNDGFDEKGEPAVLDSATMCKSSGLSEIKKQQQIFLNHEVNVSDSGIGNFNGNGTTEDALISVKDNIPTSIADLDSEDEIVNKKLEKSTMQ